jgi:hypothetical protein
MARRQSAADVHAGWAGHTSDPTLLGVDVSRDANAGNNSVNMNVRNGRLFNSAEEWLLIAIAVAWAAASGPPRWIVDGVAGATVTFLPSGLMIGSEALLSQKTAQSMLS